MIILRVFELGKGRKRTARLPGKAYASFGMSPTVIFDKRSKLHFTNPYNSIVFFFFPTVTNRFQSGLKND
jgi:hypothetical protein